jgi:hypothetical protein
MLNSFQHLLSALQIPTFVGMTASMKKCVMLMIRSGESASFRVADPDFRRDDCFNKRLS